MLKVLGTSDTSENDINYEFRDWNRNSKWCLQFRKESFNNFVDLMCNHIIMTMPVTRRSADNATNVTAQYEYTICIAIETNNFLI